MIEVAGVWEQGWSVPFTEHVSWEMVLKEFGVKRMNMTPITGIKGRFVFEYQTIQEVIEDRKHLTPVFIDENAVETLSEFEHPEDALYILGRVSHSPYKAIGGDYKALKIETPKPGLLWPHQALAITLYDRFIK